MSESPSTMNPEPNNQTPSPDHFSKIAFWKVGIIEVLVGVFILLLIFGVLNYFNILPLSNLFPKHLSFLPRQTPKDIAINITKQVSPSPGSVSKTLSSPEKENAAKISQDLVNKLIKPAYQDTLSLEEKNLVIDGETQPFPYYSANWQKNSVSARLTLQYDFINRNPLTLNISLEVPTITQIVSESSAGSIIGKYVSLPSNSKFTCDEPNPLGVVQCSTMTTQSDKSKIGFSLRANPKEASAGAKNAVILCQVFPSSSRYSWTSCLQP